MKLKAFLATFALIALVAPAGFALAQDATTTPTDESLTSIAVIVNPNQLMIDELAELKSKENAPGTGSFARFILKFKIRQLENQLNIKKALQENPA